MSTATRRRPVVRQRTARSRAASWWPRRYSPWRSSRPRRPRGRARRARGGPRERWPRGRRAPLTRRPKRSAAAAPGSGAVTPVVTGFQGWHRGRITTLGRGGSDITAVALAAALGAEACELVKEPGALHTADPRLVPEARPLPRATHGFVSAIALAGARVIHHAAAARAERDGVPLRFTSLHARRRAIDGRRLARRRDRVGGLSESG